MSYFICSKDILISHQQKQKKNVHLSRLTKKETFRHTIRHISDRLRNGLARQSEFFNISQGPHIAIKGLLNLP